MTWKCSLPPLDCGVVLSTTDVHHFAEFHIHRTIVFLHGTWILRNPQPLSFLVCPRHILSLDNSNNLVFKVANNMTPKVFFFFLHNLYFFIKLYPRKHICHYVQQNELTISCGNSGFKLFDIGDPTERLQCASFSN